MAIIWLTIGSQMIAMAVWPLPDLLHTLDRRPGRRSGQAPMRKYGSAMSCRLPVNDDVYLRLVNEADAPELYSLIGANRSYLTNWMPWAPSQTLEGTQNFIRKARLQLADNDGFQALIIKHGRIIGVIGYPAVGWGNRVTSIGYWLDQGTTGQGDDDGGGASAGRACLHCLGS
ncbi:MAG: GNAT family N-acetyltransferase [Solirubrobacterales bacterium]